MDFGNLAAHGRSPTRTALVTNPIRRVLWRLMSPYFRAAATEIDTRVDDSARNLAAELDQKTAELDQKTAQMLRDATAAWQASFISTANDSVRAAVTFQLLGIRKDATALAHRLSGLEEEAAAAAQSRDALAESQRHMRTHVNELVDSLRTQLDESVRSVSMHLNDTVDSLKAVQQEVRSIVQASNERVTEATRGKYELQHELRAAVQSLTERVDGLTRGVPIHAGDRIAVGQGSLVIAASPAGTRFLVRQRDLIGRLIVDGREWEPHVRTAIERASRPDAIAIDAGAYIGLHTITMSRWFRTVHAFEPQRGIFHMLCGNLALNSVANVEAHNVALYDRAGSVRLAPQERQEVSTPLCNGQPDYDHISNAAALSFDFVADGSGDVHAIALDDMALDDVALIKVDAQGADLRVLQGTVETIRRCQPVVLFEWERDLGFQHGAKLDDYHNFFDTIGYDVILLHDTSPGRQADYMAQPRR